MEQLLQVAQLWCYLDPANCFCFLPHPTWTPANLYSMLLFLNPRHFPAMQGSRVKYDGRRVA